jgi:hypothetical protein
LLQNNKMSKTLQNAVNLSNCVLKHVNLVVTAIETTLWTYSKNGIFISNEVSLNTNEMKDVLYLMVINHYNCEYDMLSKKKDQRIVDLYAKFMSHVDHSPLCLIHLMFKRTIDICKQIDRSQLDISDFTSYGISVEKAIRPFYSYQNIATLAPLLMHECDGPRVLDVLPEGVYLFMNTQSKLPFQCFLCRKETKQYCGGCSQKEGERYYLCSKECQKLDWVRQHPSSCSYKKKH